MTTPDNLPWPENSDPPDIPQDMMELAEAVQLALDSLRGGIAVTHWPISTLAPFGNPDAARPLTLHYTNTTAHLTGIINATSGFGSGAKPFAQIPNATLYPTYEYERFSLSINGGSVVGPRFAVKVSTSGLCQVQCFTGDEGSWNDSTWINMDLAWLIG